jgi:hypothetical protein
MDGSHFDDLTRQLHDPLLDRRRLSKISAALLFSALMTKLGIAPDEAAAQACRTAGAKCKRGSDCCSGSCKRKGRNGKKRCRGNGTAGVCQADQNACVSAAECAPGCSCFQTLADDPVCGDRSGTDPCDADTDCRGKPGLEQAVCVKGGPLCQDVGATFCALPCQS